MRAKSRVGGTEGGLDCNAIEEQFVTFALMHKGLQSPSAHINQLTAGDSNQDKEVSDAPDE